MAGAYGGYQPRIGTYGYPKHTEAMSQAKSPLRGLMDVAEEADAREQQARKQAEEDANFNQLLQRMRRNPQPVDPKRIKELEKQMFIGPML
jgi:hypothetical protein